MEELQILLLSVILVILLLQRKTPHRKMAGHKLVLDSSALIDGRIAEVVKSGFAPAVLVIPRFIVLELQLLADGQDAYKRERARFGLDVAQSLQNDADCEVIVEGTDFADISATDEKLVKLANKLSASLCTTDYNLNKVATIEGVKVLNVNELAKALRPVVLPGEKEQVRIVQKGSNKNQGVGYLSDGTMVVVDEASKLIGKTVEVQVSRYIQTDAGKMLFASLCNGSRKLSSKSSRSNR